MQTAVCSRWYLAEVSFCRLGIPLGFCIVVSRWDLSLSTGFGYTLSTCFGYTLHLAEVSFCLQEGIPLGFCLVVSRWDLVLSTGFRYSSQRSLSSTPPVVSGLASTSEGAGIPCWLSASDSAMARSIMGCSTGNAGETTSPSYVSSATTIAGISLDQGFSSSPAEVMGATSGRHLPA